MKYNVTNDVADRRLSTNYITAQMSPNTSIISFPHHKTTTKNNAISQNHVENLVNKSEGYKISLKKNVSLRMITLTTILNNDATHIS